MDGKPKGTSMGEAIGTTFRNSEDAKQLSHISLIVASLAFIASTISVYFSYQDSVTDEQWQQSQIEVLEKLVIESSLMNEKYSKQNDILEAELTEVEKSNGILLEILNKPNVVKIEKL